MSAVPNLLTQIRMRKAGWRMFARFGLTLSMHDENQVLCKMARRPVYDMSLVTLDETTPNGSNWLAKDVQVIALNEFSMFNKKVYRAEYGLYIVYF